MSAGLKRRFFITFKLSFPLSLADSIFASESSLRYPSCSFGVSGIDRISDQKEESRFVALLSVLKFRSVITSGCFCSFKAFFSYSSIILLNCLRLSLPFSGTTLAGTSPLPCFNAAISSGAGSIFSSTISALINRSLFSSTL